jgi:hypothetical protein
VVVSFTRLDNESVSRKEKTMENKSLERNGGWICLQRVHNRYSPSWGEVFMKKMRLLSMVFLLGGLSSCAFSAKSQSLTPTQFTDEQGITYTRDGDYFSVHSFVGPAKDVVVPATVLNFSVTQLLPLCFNNASEVLSVVLPTSIVSIGASSFSGCTALKTLRIPSGITALNYSTFQNDVSLKGVYLPKSLLSIGQWCFDGASALKNVYYEGTEQDWTKVSVSSTGNASLLAATLLYESY